MIDNPSVTPQSSYFNNNTSSFVCQYINRKKINKRIAKKLPENTLSHVKEIMGIVLLSTPSNPRKRNKSHRVRKRWRWGVS